MQLKTPTHILYLADKCWESLANEMYLKVKDSMVMVIEEVLMRIRIVSLWNVCEAYAKH